MGKLAFLGSKPVSEKRVRLAQPVSIEKTVEDIGNVFRSGDIRQGPKTSEFEERFREKVGARNAYVVNSGTAVMKDSLKEGVDHASSRCSSAL